MQIFLTGASGFVGGAFMRMAAGRYPLIAMSRDARSDAIIAQSRAKPVRSSLNDVTAITMAGADAVIHAAAYMETWGDAETYRHVNVEGTKRMLKEARAAGVKRFVHIGTEAALLRGQALVNVDETYPLALDSPFPYARTKALAEQAVREANDPSGGFDTIVLRPRFVWGPGDRRLLPSLQAMADRRAFLWVDGGRHRTSTTYIGNLCHAMDRALIAGRGGEAYFVLDDGGPTTFRDFLPKLAATAGFDLDGPSAPGWLLRPVVAGWERAYRRGLTRSTPPASAFNINILSRDCILLDDKAKRELAYVAPLSRDEGLAAMHMAFRHSNP